MKKLLLISAIVSTIVACSSSGAGDKKAELENFKKQKKELDDKIKKLETEIAKGDSSRSEKAILVSVTEATPATFVHYIELQGRVDAEDNVTVTPQMPGTIQNVYVTVGQNVKKGQV